MSCDQLFYIRNYPKYAFGTIPSEAYVSGARAHARIADLSIQTLVVSQSNTKYTPRRSSGISIPHYMCRTHRLGLPYLMVFSLLINATWRILLYTMLKLLRIRIRSHNMFMWTITWTICKLIKFCVRLFIPFHTQGSFQSAPSVFE